MAQPLRKIIGKKGDYDLLECGHRRRAWTGAKKSRRCDECAMLVERPLEPWEKELKAQQIAHDRRDNEDYKERR